MEANAKIKELETQMQALRESEAKTRAKLTAYERRDNAAKALREAEIPADVLSVADLLPFEPHQWAPQIAQAKRAIEREKKLMEGGAGEHVPAPGGGQTRGGDSVAEAIAAFNQQYDGRR